MSITVKINTTNSNIATCYQVSECQYILC